MSKLHVTFVTCDEKPWLEALHGLAVSQRGVIEIYINYFHQPKIFRKMTFCSALEINVDIVTQQQVKH